MDDQAQEENQNSVSQDGFATLDDVQDGEIVSETSDNSQVLTSLDEMIKSHVQSIDRLKVEAQKLKETIDDGFVNDPVYREHDEAAKASAKVKQATKAQIMKQPAVLTLVQKLKTLTSELKEKKLSLSDYLLEYQKLSGANQIEMEDGEVLEIVNSAKVVKRASVK